MATVTPNFGWDVPQSTDLVKDGATAIAALGNDIDTSLVDLKGGTTGQVLSKASNTDMDFTWSSVDPLTILDAKGDLISATAADTPARLASSGVNGDVLTVDTTTSTGLKWAAPASGGMTLISTTSLSGSNKVGLTSIPSTYTNLQLIIDRPTVASGGNWKLTIYPNDTTSAICSEISGRPNALNQNNGSDHFGELVTYGQAATKIIIAYNFLQYANTSTYKPINYFGMASSNVAGTFNETDPFAMFGSGFMYSTTAISSLYLYTSSGVNFSGGTAYLYGVK